MAKELPGRLVALSASAVATIYLAGLVSTQPAAATIAAAAASPVASVSTSASSPARRWIAQRGAVRRIAQSPTVLRREQAHSAEDLRLAAHQGIAA